MKNNMYVQPMTTVVKVESEKMVATSTGANHVAGNIFNQGSISGSNQAARVKQNTYDVWEDDWSN